ncbi:MAG: restriction endonuclease subunit S [Deltaproteobacteria bacterium]|nr:restriction endonuclease subunit S [Deltaproteobacteria bacterium]
MGNEWKTIPATDFCASVRDGTHDSPKQASEGNYLVTSRHITGNRVELDKTYKISSEDFEAINRRSKVDRWDVLVTMIGTVGEPCLVKDEPNFAIKNIGLFKSNSELEGKWLYYYLLSPIAQHLMKTYSRGSTQQYIPLGALREFPIIVTNDKKEMEAIVHILGSLDDKIEQNRRMNETLEAMARTIFKSWFVDFDPVHAKAEGRDPGLPREIADLFPDSFQDSELGPIPKGWKVGVLSDLSRLNPEAWLNETRPETIDYVDLSNTKWGHIDAVTKYTKEEAPSRAQRVLRLLDTIVGTVRPGNGSYAFITVEGLTGSTGFAVLRPTKQYHAEFVYLAATARENIESLAHLADGAAYPAVRPKVVSATRIVKPNAEILQSFSGIVGSMLSKIATNEKESCTLASLRDALLPKLISGELDVFGFDRCLKEVV